MLLVPRNIVMHLNNVVPLVNDANNPPPSLAPLSLPSCLCIMTPRRDLARSYPAWPIIASTFVVRCILLWWDECTKVKTILLEFEYQSSNKFYQFTGISNQVYRIDNWFDLNFEPISLHVVDDFMIWYPYLQLHKINFINCMTLFHKEQDIMYKIILIAPHK